MSEYTVGPWFKNEDGQLQNEKGERVGIWGCGLTGVYKSERAIANSRLIASSPCLLSALIAITNSGPDAIPINEAFEMAHRAIERATSVGDS